MLRIGRHAIVAFPNFGHWSVRLAHLWTGGAPKTELFPHEWYDSPNIHFLTVFDFEISGAETELEHRTQHLPRRWPSGENVSERHGRSRGVPVFGDRMNLTGDAGKRLDHFLQEHLPQFSRSRLQSWIKEGRVLVNGSAAKASMTLHGGERR